MRIVVFGGSFNPVHVGHLILAEEALEALSADICILVPAYKPPHKDLADGASDADRIDMLRKAIEGDGRLTVDACELERGGISYTVDTLGQLIEKHKPDGKPYLLLGDDLAAGFSSWRRPDEIAGMAELVLAHRGSREFPDFPWPHRVLANRLVEISSSDLRDKISRGVSCRQALPKGVYDIILERRLYRGERAGCRCPDGGIRVQ